MHLRPELLAAAEHVSATKGQRVAEQPEGDHGDNRAEEVLHQGSFDRERAATNSRLEQTEAELHDYTQGAHDARERRATSSAAAAGGRCVQLNGASACFAIPRVTLGRSKRNTCLPNRHSKDCFQ